MDAVQRLRARAQAEGNLKSTKEQEVKVGPVAAQAAPPAPAAPAAPPPPAQSTTVITIRPTNPQVVYVPTYNPTVVYGAWPYPAYPPYSYYPPGYVAATSIISFGAGMAVGAALWGGCNWGRGDVDIDVNRYNNFTRNVNNTNLQNRISTREAGGGRQWQHNPEHRKGVQYRDQATQQRYGKADQAGVQRREEFRGRADQGRQALDRGAADQLRQGGQGQRGQGGLGDRGQGGVGDRGQGGLADRGGQRAGGSSLSTGGASPAGGALQGVGSGNQARDFSNRGNASISQARGGGGFQGAAGAQRGGGGARGGGGGGGRRR